MPGAGWGQAGRTFAAGEGGGGFGDRSFAAEGGGRVRGRTLRNRRRRRQICTSTLGAGQGSGGLGEGPFAAEEGGAGAGPRPPPLRYNSPPLRSVQFNIRLWHLSRRTEPAYIYWIKRFLRHFRGPPPKTAGPRGG